jgi:omega-6 fatty acid desaturase (delta-12 desaturase)
VNAAHRRASQQLPKGAQVRLGRLHGPAGDRPGRSDGVAEARSPILPAPVAAMVPQLARLKALKREVIERHVRPDDLRGLLTVLTTVLPIAVLLALLRPSAQLSYALTGAIVLLTSLFLLRAFVLMRECGHGSLFRSGALNRGFGFVLGVVAGMPQFVWSRHHQYHHATNGNWGRYRGPLNIATVHDYVSMSAAQQRRYRHARSVWLAPLGGFAYLVVNPRLTWLKGSAQLLLHLARSKCAQPGVSLRAHVRDFRTRSWATAQEYRHMGANNLALLALWGVLAWLVGPMLFFGVYITALSLAGGAGIAIVTVQHNFEHAYASGDDGWDYHRAALEGTSFLLLPPWLNWFTANIAFHHVHHLSARMPSYCLAGCHDEYAALFADVTRIGFAQIPRALRCILWDTQAKRIVSVAELRQAALRPA